MNKRTQDASRSARALNEVNNAVSLSRANGVEYECSADTQKPFIVVCEPRVLFRECFVKCLQETDDNCIVLGHATLAEWLATGPNQSPTLILLSIRTRRPPDALCPEVSLLAQHGISAPIIILSEIEDVTFVVSILEAGARGYIPTSLSLNIALEAMHFVEAGGIFAPASSLMSRPHSAQSFDLHTEDEKKLFTARQAAVLAALRRGKANKQIAYELNMREGTVKVHIRHIMKKLKARNRTEAVVLANGLFAGTDLS
jgi:DNA-binding NarL/FixJ family response regulator